MAMPNRAAHVKAIALRYPQAFGEPMATVDDRRRLLIPIVVRELNKIDGNNWFVLNRMDRNDADPKPGRLTSDVIVWGPTKEHVDVLGANGPMWKAHPAITDRQWLLETWDQWPSWDGPPGSLGPSAPTPVDPPVDPPVTPAPPVSHDGTVDQKLDALKDQLTRVEGRQDRPLFPVPEDTDGSQ